MSSRKTLFPDEEIAEAAGVLEMISQTPDQLMLYNARLKFQLDAEARLQKAREDGIREGEARGARKDARKGFWLDASFCCRNCSASVHPRQKN